MSLSEAEFETQHVEPLATMLGWRWAHFSDSRRQVRPGVHVGDAKARGWPDMVLCRDRLVHAELKAGKGRLRPEQREWLDGLTRAGAEAYLWRPSDLDEIAEVLSKRWHYRGHALTLTLFEGDPHPWWTPGSMWMPGQGRADQQ